jgi:transcriptional accessory protein Tex/SPT6
MHDVKMIDLSRIAQDLQIRKVQVESVVQLLDEGNTIPFVTRYRKERTGGLNEEVIRQIQMRVAQARQLAERKETILKSIDGQGKLTEELRAAIVGAETSKRLEDLYLPYKPKKRTLATTARERGLEPLALAIWNRDPAVANLSEVLPTLVNPEKQLATPEDVLLGVQHILAEQVAETADVRQAVRHGLWETGKLTAVKSDSLAEGQGLEYKDYFQFTESARHIPPHRILAINRGEKEGSLKVRLDSNGESIHKAVQDKLPLADHPHAEFLKTVGQDALTRLVLPSLEREVRRELTEEAEIHAVKVFARNLRSLLLQPPLHQRRVLAVDPGFRTGCKLAALDEHGNLLEDAVIFPHPPQNKKADAKLKLEELVRKHQLNVIAIGNGAACRETEELVSELIAHLETQRSGAVSFIAPAVFEAAPAAAPVAELPAVAPPPPPEVASAVPGPCLAEASAALPVVGEAGAAAPLGALDQGLVAATSVGIIVSSLTQALPAPAPIAAGPHAARPLPSPGIPPTPTPSPLANLPQAPPDLAYVIVNEAGASVYSASAVGREEFPDYDATLRGTISIGRRLQDPLSELVKIDPQSIGVGLYQHDVHPRHLRESVDAIIESSVNYVGIDLNTASVPLLRHVSGLNQLAARELIDFRKQHGPFRRREQLLQVPSIGPARYVQAAGFLKIIGGDNPLDRTWIHPESYPVVQQLLGELGYSPAVLEDKEKTEELQEKLKTLSPEEVSARLAVGTPTLRDIIEALKKPGRDPREDLPPPIFKKGILKLEDLQPGMELKGTVLNVVDFGAFVDIGLKDSGLVHISQMANRYIKNPYDVAAVGDVVTVWVLAVDNERRRVSLTMIRPGTERKPPERKPPPRSQRSGRPRGRRPAPKQGQAPGTAPAAAAPAAPNPPTAVAAEACTPPAVVAAPSREPAPAAAPPPPRPASQPRKPQRRPPRPKLSQAALEGAAPLRTFSELKAFFEAKDREEKTKQTSGTPNQGSANP